jgi:hypothetical protein
MNFFVREKRRLTMNTQKPNLPADIKPEEKAKAAAPGQPANQTAPEEEAKKAV